MSAFDRYELFVATDDWFDDDFGDGPAFAELMLRCRGCGEFIVAEYGERSPSLAEVIVEAERHTAAFHPDRVGACSPSGSGTTHAMTPDQLHAAESGRAAGTAPPG